MPQSCVAFNCTNRYVKGSGISFHRFPFSKPELLQRWVFALRRKNFFPSRQDVICSEHFAPETFTDRVGGRILKRNAVPSIFDFSEHVGKTMPNRCCVPFCKGNHLNGPKVSVFSFPRNDKLLKKWLDAIHWKDFLPKRNSRVCSLHFQESDFEREVSAYDPKTGKTLTARLGNIRLKKDAVPSLLDPNYPDMPLNKKDHEEEKSNEQFSHGLQQNVTNTEPKSCHLKDLPHPKSPLKSENIAKPKKKIIRKRKKSASDTTLSKEIKDIPEKIQVNNNQIVLSNDNFADKNHNVSNSSQSLPAVPIKVEKPWQEEYNYVEHLSGDVSRDCDRIQIEIGDVWSVLNKEKSSSSEKVDRNKVEITGIASTCARPLKIKKREEIFGKLVASEISDLCKNPELYFKTKQAILNILVQAQYEQLKSSGPIL